MSETYLRRPDVVDAEVDGERVLMAVDSGEYFGLNPVGSFLWPVLASPRTLDDLVASVVTEFAVDHTVCRPDVEQFVQQLCALELVERRQSV
jgi:Coenzyme PQQ synthesis protein D (PqqD)